MLLSTTHPLSAYRDVRFSWAFAPRPGDRGTQVVLRARGERRGARRPTG